MGWEFGGSGYDFEFSAWLYDFRNQQFWFESISHSDDCADGSAAEINPDGNGSDAAKNDGTYADFYADIPLWTAGRIDIVLDSKSAF